MSVDHRRIADGGQRVREQVWPSRREFARMTPATLNAFLESIGSTLRVIDDRRPRIAPELLTMRSPAPIRVRPEHKPTPYGNCQSDGERWPCQLIARASRLHEPLP